MKPFTSSVGGVALITVPDESALVVQTVSVQINVTAGHRTSATIRYVADGQTTSLFLPVSYAYRSPANYDTYHAAVALVLYVDAGTDIELDQYSPDGTTGTPFLTISGYLSDL